MTLKRFLISFPFAITLLFSFAPPASAGTIYIAGDSTTSEYGAEDYPRMGWGQVLGHFYGDEIEVIDRAQSGRSAKSFINEGFFAGIESQIGPGDILLIQFGHNDEKFNSPERYAAPDTDYKRYLEQYVDMARAKDATPVLLTSIVRRKFEAGKRVPTHGRYPGAMRELAAEKSVNLIDMTRLSGEFIDRLGEEKSKAIYLHYTGADGPVEDNTHFSERGAYAMAAIVVRELDARHIQRYQPPPEASGQVPNNAADYAAELIWIKTQSAFYETEGIN